MKISLLESRENFDAIFLSSLHEFMASRFGKSVEIVSAKQGDITFRKNTLVNLIYSSNLEFSEKNKLTNEFRYAPNLFRRYLQTLYCFLAVNPPLDHMLSPAFFGFKNPPDQVRNWAFLPGNHSIRIIDTLHNRSIVFSKRGFNKQFLAIDAEMRLAHPYLPAPKVLELDPDLRWYIEERVVGIPINRLKDDRIVLRAEKQAQKGLVQLRSETFKMVVVEDHVSQLQNHIFSLYERLEPDNYDLMQSVKSIARKVTDIALTYGSATIGLCQSHGDFQSANILTDGRQTWVIDWEYSAERIAFYDFMVYTTKCRFPIGLSSRLKSLNVGFNKNQGVDAWGWFQSGTGLLLISLFLLEDMNVKLKEIEADPILNKAGAMKSWLREVRSFFEDVQSL